MALRISLRIFATVLLSFTAFAAGLYTDEEVLKKMIRTVRESPALSEEAIIRSIMGGATAPASDSRGSTPTSEKVSAPTSPTPTPSPTPTEVDHDTTASPTCSSEDVDLTVADFGCPAGDDPENWIQATKVVKKNGKSTNLTHYHLPTDGSWTLRILKNGDKRRFQKCTQHQGQGYMCCRDVSEATQKTVPTTVQPLADQGILKTQGETLKKYHEGAYLDGENKFVPVDGEVTYFWELDGATRECYAMATFLQIQMRNNNLFVTDSDDAFAKAYHLRMLKMAVCKKTTSNQTKCASRKVAISCWIVRPEGHGPEEPEDPDDPDWVRCSGTEPAFAAVIAGRS